MKIKAHVQSLYRSPLKTMLTFLLLFAAAFLFLYNLGEYSVSDREYREARDKYQGVLTVEEQAVPDNSSVFDFFLISDETNPGDNYGKYTYENYHQKSLDEDQIAALASLPYISRVEKRYLTAGVSPELIRLDTDHKFFPYFGRCVLVATVKNRYPSLINSIPRLVPDHALLEFVTLKDVEVLAGDPSWLMGQEEQTVYLQFDKDELWGQLYRDADTDYNGRCSMLTIDNRLFTGDADILEPGRRYVFVLRNNSVEQETAPLPELEDVYPKKTTHLFAVGDDSLIDWWPYFTDITDLQENWLESDEFADLRELIQVTNDDVHTFDVVYGDDMASQRRVSEGRIVCDEGRFITPADAGQPVCVVNIELMNAYGLKVGDNITLNLGNYLSEQYAPLGAVAVTRGRQNTAYTTQTFTIIGSWRDLNEGAHVFRDWFWCWSNNAIFVPSTFLPECRNAAGHTFKPSEVSFVVGNAEEISPFVDKAIPQLETMELTYMFSDGGWLTIVEDLMQARSIALVKLLIVSGAAAFALLLTVWLFIGRKKREYAIYRALGMQEREAGARLYAPFLLLSLISALMGLMATRVVTSRQLTAETAHAPVSLLLYLLGTLFFLALLALLAWGGLLLIRRRSILGLLNGNGAEKGKKVRKTEDVPHSTSVPQVPAVTEELGGSSSKNWGGRYLRRLLGRNPGRSLLSLFLAALLISAFGLLTVLRNIYAELYRNVEVKAVFTGGLSYDRAQRIAESGYVRDPYYEYVTDGGLVEMDGAYIILTNRLDKQVSDPIQWLEGWDEASAMNTEQKVCVMYASHAEYLGFHLGDMVRVNEMDWWNNISSFGSQALEPGETQMGRRDRMRPFFQLVGIIQSDTESRNVFIPAEARYTLRFLIPKFELDLAEYTLADYHQAAEFTEYAKGQLDKSQTAVQFTMDTSYADRIYKMHRLIETLYPLTIAAALLLGGVLPGLTVLHGSKEISILRAIGVKIRKSVGLYTMAQVLCALLGLVLGIAVVLLIRHPDLNTVLRPFAIYLVAHLLACAIGSGVFSWLSARKHVLAQLQAKE